MGRSFLKKSEQILEESPLDQREIDLVREVSMLNPYAMPWIFVWRNLSLSAEGFPYIDSLKWLKKNGVIGDMLVEWIQDKFQNSPLKAAEFLRQKVNSEFKTRPFISKLKM